MAIFSENQLVHEKSLLIIVDGNVMQSGKTFSNLKLFLAKLNYPVDELQLRIVSDPDGKTRVALGLANQAARTVSERHRIGGKQKKKSK